MRQEENALGEWLKTSEVRTKSWEIQKFKVQSKMTQWKETEGWKADGSRQSWKKCCRNQEISGVEKQMLHGGQLRFRVKRTTGLGNELCGTFNENGFKEQLLWLSAEPYFKRKDKSFDCSSPLPSIPTLSHNKNKKIITHQIYSFIIIVCFQWFFKLTNHGFYKFSTKVVIPRI